MRFVSAALLLFAGLLTARVAHAEDAPASGAYRLDQAHTCISFKISHLGFSHFDGRFDKAEGTLDYNADAPEQTQLDVTIYPNSVDTNDSELDDDLRGENWFDPIKYPTATFHATKIERTGDATARITGDFTLRGVTHRLVLDTTLVGTGTDDITGKQVMGFSATASFDRSDYGMHNLIPMVGDEVQLQIDCEFDKDKP